MSFGVRNLEPVSAKGADSQLVAGRQLPAVLTHRSRLITIESESQQFTSLYAAARMCGLLFEALPGVRGVSYRLSS
jgi:hypothetical protein